MYIPAHQKKQLTEVSIIFIYIMKLYIYDEKSYKYRNKYLYLCAYTFQGYIPIHTNYGKRYMLCEDIIFDTTFIDNALTPISFSNNCPCDEYITRKYSIAILLLF